MSLAKSLTIANPTLIGIALAGTLLLAGNLFAQAPNLTGSWQMDPAKSHVSEDRSMSLMIQSVGNKIKLTGTVHEKSGKEMAVEFTCAPDGKECEFNEGGHKSKISMWFSGDSLNIAKTDGPAGDVVDEWKLQTSEQGKVLTLTVNHIEPAGADETLVFNKAS
jgi:hypothetical protein